MINPKHDLVCMLLVKPFSHWKINDKMDVISYGKPTPEICFSNLKQIRNRYFRSVWYTQYEWLCGSVYKQTLFCWWCLLCESKNIVWCKCGFKDVANAGRGFRKHEHSVGHLKAALEMKYLARSLNDIKGTSVCIPPYLIMKHNGIVDLNRKIIDIHFNIILYMASQEVSCKLFDNGRYFKEILEELLLECPNDVQQQYRKLQSVFKAESKFFQIKLIKCLSQFLNSLILKEIDKASFFSVLVDTTDVLETCQCSVVIRYVNCTGHVVEYFLGFHNVGADVSGKGMFRMLHDLLTPLQYQTKLVAQCYDNVAGSVKDELLKLQKFIKHEAPAATCVHSLAQHLNLVLEQAVTQMSECKIFFSNLIGFPSFFQNSSKGTKLLNEIIGEHMPTVASTKYSSYSKLITVIAEKYLELKTIFQTLIKDLSTDFVTLKEAHVLLSILNDAEFAYMVQVFLNVYKITDHLWSNLLKKPLNIRHCLTQIATAQNLLTQQKNKSQHEKMFMIAHKLANTQTNDNNFVSVSFENKTSEFIQIYFNIIDTIKLQLRETFQDMKMFTFLALVDSGHYKTAQSVLPSWGLLSLINAYPFMFNHKQLEAQLLLFYVDENFSELNVEETVFKLKDLELDVILNEVYLLFTLVLTLPSISVVKTFSCLEKLKSFTRNTTSKDRFSPLASIYIQSDHLAMLRDEDPGFIKKLIDYFAEINKGELNLSLQYSFG